VIYHLKLRRCDNRMRLKSRSELYNPDGQKVHVGECFRREGEMPRVMDGITCDTGPEVRGCLSSRPQTLTKIVSMIADHVYHYSQA